MNTLIAHHRYDINTSDTYATMNKDNITEILALISLNEKHKHTSSGASLCLTELKLLKALGFTKENLIHCNKIITAVGGSEISCLDWLPIKFKIYDNTTTHPAYICDKEDNIYYFKKWATKRLPDN